MQVRRRVWVILLVISARLAATEPVDYQLDIKPLLAARCVRCHGPDRQKSALRLDTARQAIAGGNRGEAIVPGQASASLLIDAVRGRRDVPLMPPEGERLSPQEIARLEAWINAGAPAPAVEAAAEPKATTARHWAFEPIRRRVAPRPSETSWPRSWIDAFILERLQGAELRPSSVADRITLLRRLSLDLTGLPPSPEEVDAFVADESPDAYERRVDQLLASPHLGERWARHWLDCARYADSNGYTIDGSRSIWKYRDWVIDAFNDDKSFRDFTIEQIAGDMLPAATVSQRIATGFHRNTLRNEEGGTDQEQFRIEAVADRVSTTGAVFLGLTVGCARCHDHKYDPISQREYYQLFALFNNADEPTLQVPTAQQKRELPVLATEFGAAEKLLADNELAVGTRQTIWERDLAGKSPQELEKAGIPPATRAILERPASERGEAETRALAQYYKSIDKDWVPLAQRVADLKQRQNQLRAAITTSMVLEERREPRTTRVHIRGDFLRGGARVAGGVPAVLPPLANRERPPHRLDLARWLVDDANPLTARVLVNRLWQVYFGQGIVSTENDFGSQGAPPTHPELLDSLAAELMAAEWSLKAMHRLLVTSATYRQASVMRSELVERDPYNRLLGKQARLRVEAECVRDVALAASGLLCRELGGPGVYPPQPQGIYRFTQTAKYWQESQGGDRYRRGLYTYFWRSSPNPFLSTFDAPDATQTCTRRGRSNTPLQALTLANDPAFFEMARSLASRALREVEGGSRDRIRHLFRLVLARPPNDRELERLQAFFVDAAADFAVPGEEARGVAPQHLPTGVPLPEGAAWTALARVLLNLDEAITRE